MKNIKKHPLLCLGVLLLQQNFYAGDNQENELKEAVTILAPLALGAMTGRLAYLKKCSDFAIINATATPYGFKKFYDTAQDSEDKDLMSNSHPHTQEWFNTIAKKYPAANLSKVPLSTKDIGLDQVLPIGASFNKIYLGNVPATYINNLWAKKEKLSDTDFKNLSAYEWVMLHESHHIKKNDVRNSALILYANIIASEVAYQAYNKKFTTPAAPTPKANWSTKLWNVTKSIPKRFGIYMAMGVLSKLGHHIYMSNAERQADAFANQHADINALKAGKKMFEFFQNAEDAIPKESPLYGKVIAKNLTDTHPTHKERAQTIQDEIDRREKVQAITDRELKKI